MRLSPFTRYALIGTSLANLVFLDVWRVLFRANTPASSSLMVRRVDFVALMVTILATGLAAACVAVGARRTGLRWLIEAQRGIFLASFLLLAETARRIYMIGAPRAAAALGRYALVASWTAVVVAGGIAIVVWRRRVVVSRVYATGLLALAPGIAVTFVNAAWCMKTVDFAAFRDMPPSPMPAAGPRPSTRVVVLLFDELDQQWGFDRRPTDVRLPAFDRFEREASRSLALRPPAQNTIEAIPSYLVGRRIARTMPRGPRSLAFDMGIGGAPVASLDTMPTFVSRAAALNASVGIVGNYLPYCRLAFARHVQRCTWIPLADGGIAGRGDSGLFRTMGRQVRSLSPTWNRASHLARHLVTLDAAKRMVADTALNLVFVHFAVPHLAAIFDRRSDRPTLWNRSPRGYFDNLVLADHALADVRRAMESAGVWNRTAVIVTSDHPWRSATPVMGSRGTTIPFMVKAPAGSPADTVPPLTDAVRFADYVIALLDPRSADRVAAP